MAISAAFASPLSAQDRRLLACLAASLAAHAFALFARMPLPDELPRFVIPPIQVRVVEIPPPPKPQPRVEPRPVPAPPPVLAVEKPAALAVAPQVEPKPDAKPPAKPPAKPAVAFDPPMTEQEKARLDPRYQPAAAVDRVATALDDRREPPYPPEAMEQGLTGCVLVVVYVGASGKVENLEVLRSDPPKIFDRAAMRAFVNAQYLPAVKDNAPVATRIAGVASFELEGKPSPMCALRYFPIVSELDGKPLGARSDARK
jgi:protein TonB